MNSSTLVRRGALLGLVGGLLFVPYAISKSTVTAHVAATGWHLPGLNTSGTTQLYHAIEVVPVVMMAAGVVALATATEDLQHGLGRAAVALTLTGFASMTVFHWAEHLLFPLTVPAVTGSLNWFEAGYYAGWVTINLGLFACGLVLTHSLDRTSSVSHVLLVPLPLGLIVGAAAVLTGAYTFAGTHRLVAAGTWILVGMLLWQSRDSDSGDQREAPSQWTRTDEQGHDRG